MSVIIKGMQMPKSCIECPIFSGAGCKATMTMFNALTNVAVRVKGCPLVEIPEKHGRLIDENTILVTEIRDYRGDIYEIAHIPDIEAAATIIEAEE